MYTLTVLTFHCVFVWPPAIDHEYDVDIYNIIIIIVIIIVSIASPFRETIM